MPLPSRVSSVQAIQSSNVIDYIYTYYCNYLYIKQLYTYREENGSTVTMVGISAKYVFLDGGEGEK